MTEPSDALQPAVHRDRPALPTDAADLPDLGAGYASSLADGLTSLGLTLAGAAHAAIDAQARLLLAWNQHINLTAIRTPEGIARLHILDSLSAVPVLRKRLSDAPAVLDLGSGGGYPGLPLAVALPAARLTFVDSVAKKTRFLEVVADAAREAFSGKEAGDQPDVLALEVITARAEQLAAGALRESWDVVTVRAVGTLAEVAELGLPLLRRGGLLVCWKRQAVALAAVRTADLGLGQEIEDARGLVTQLGGEPVEVVPVEGACLAGHRLVLVRKAHPTPRRFPRLPAERRRRLLR